MVDATWGQQRREIQELRNEVSRMRRGMIEAKGRGQEDEYFVAVPENKSYDIGPVLDSLGIDYDTFGHNEEWSVLKIYLPRSRSGHTYEGALEAVGVDPNE